MVARSRGRAWRAPGRVIWLAVWIVLCAGGTCSFCRGFVRPLLLRWLPGADINIVVMMASGTVVGPWPNTLAALIVPI